MPGDGSARSSWARIFTSPREVKSNRRSYYGSSLTEEVVKTALASRCERFHLLSNVAADLKRTGIDSQNLISFEIGDCVPLMPFNKLGIRMAKTDWSGQKKESVSSTGTE
jgi:hypothetical protein